MLINNWHNWPALLVWCIVLSLKLYNDTFNKDVKADEAQEYQYIQ